MKKLEHLEKYVREPDTQFYGAYFYDGEDIILHDDIEEFKDDKNEKVEIRLAIKDTIENGVFKKHKKLEDLRTNATEETFKEYPVEKGDMLVFVMNEGFSKVKGGLIPVKKAIELYEIIKGD